MQIHYLCLLCKWTLEIRRVKLLKMLWVDVVKKINPNEIQSAWKYVQKLKLLLMHENILTSKYIQKEIACFKKKSNYLFIYDKPS